MMKRESSIGQIVCKDGLQGYSEYGQTLPYDPVASGVH